MAYLASASRNKRFDVASDYLRAVAQGAQIAGYTGEYHFPSSEDLAMWLTDHGIPVSGSKVNDILNQIREVRMVSGRGAYLRSTFRGDAATLLPVQLKQQLQEALGRVDTLVESNQQLQREWRYFFSSWLGGTTFKRRLGSSPTLKLRRLCFSTSSCWRRRT